MILPLSSDFPVSSTSLLGRVGQLSCDGVVASIGGVTQSYTGTVEATSHLTFLLLRSLAGCELVSV